MCYGATVVEADPTFLLRALPACESSRWPATRDGTLDYRGGPLLTEDSSEIDVDLNITKSERVTPTLVLIVLPVRVPLAEAVVGWECPM
jgi:hypothetical protein